MKAEWTNHYVTFTREDGDKKYYNGSWSSGESQLLYAIKTWIKLNYWWDMIKKRAAKDGCMVDDDQQYIRTRNKSCKCPHIYIYNHRYAIEGAEEAWNKDGKVTLMYETDIFGVGQEFNPPK